MYLKTKALDWTWVGCFDIKALGTWGGVVTTPACITLWYLWNDYWCGSRYCRASHSHLSSEVFPLSFYLICVRSRQHSERCFQKIYASHQLFFYMELLSTCLFFQAMNCLFHRQGFSSKEGRIHWLLDCYSSPSGVFKRCPSRMASWGDTKGFILLHT